MTDEVRTPIDDYLQECLGINATNGRILDLEQPGYSASRHPDDTETGGITKDVAFNRLDFDGGEIVSPFNDGHVNVGNDDIEVTLEQDFDDEVLRHIFTYANQA